MKRAFSIGLVAASASAISAQESLHFTYLWHLEQPIYWPDQSRQPGAPDRYENAWESIQRKNLGEANPENNLVDIFSKADRVAAYQYRMRDSIDSIRWAPEAGAQVSYSGGLIRNIESLGQAGQLGYTSSWNQPKQQARSWRTSGQNKPRLDVVVFPFHHSLMPLLEESTQRKEIQAYKHVYTDTWGTTAPVSSGFFPSEMAFSTRLIKVLDEEGIDWSVVSAEKISRACADFPVVLGSGGVNCEPPNLADQLNPAQGTSAYYRVQISRGCAPAEAYPFALTPRRARYADPASNPDNPTLHEIIAVPASQSVSWEDGYNPLGTQHFQALETRNDPNRPMLVTLAHDGDNAFGGGFSYYLEATPNLVSSAQSQGFHATVVEEYLADHPVPVNDVVHVEDGAWVNADGDFGSPTFLNWNYPPVNAQGQVDIENGWAEDIRNWAVITAAQNHVDTAEQISEDNGLPVRISDVISPDAGSRPAERAWHYFLGALNSGYMYYGTALDFEVKPAIACNEALEHTSQVIPTGTDLTAPTIWIPQRFPWNPGSMNFGSPHGYTTTVMPTNFHIWTFVDDVSDVSSVTLKYRIDADGVNPLNDYHNETYDGRPTVAGTAGDWTDLPMTSRVFPVGNVYNDPSINFFEMPAEIADQYYVEVTGLSDVLVDYYVEAVDTLGNVKRSPIQHVWVGDGEGSNPGGDRVVLEPETPIAGESVTITYDPQGGPLVGANSVFLHYGFNGWSSVNPTDPLMSYDAVDQTWSVNVPIASNATQLDIVFNDGSGIWDNNSGQDWHFAVSGGEPPAFTIDGSLDPEAVLVAQNAGISLHAGLDGDQLYVAMTPPASRDHFLFVADTPGPLAAAMWAKSGQVAGWDAFIGAESTGSFAGWFDAANATVARGSVVEGLIDLNAEFGGGIPDTIHLAVGAYQTDDGGSLESQAPAGDGDTTLESSEYIEITLCELDNSCNNCPADVNGDGVVSPTDFTAWINAFNNNLPECDQNADGSCSPTDFTAWIANFNAGCP
ncbi:MAG: hypothetical protein Phyf2KO_02620 [Phycisphaerales bacterium]